MAHKKVSAAPALKNWVDVDNALREIHEAENTLAELEAEKNRRIDAIKQDYAQIATPLQNRIKRLEADTREYVGEHRAEMTGKSRRLTFGTVGYRSSSKLVVPTSRLAEIIGRLKSMGLYDCIKTTESLDKEALKKQPTEVILEAGASIKQEDEFYYDIDHDEIADTAGV